MNGVHAHGDCAFSSCAWAAVSALCMAGRTCVVVSLAAIALLPGASCAAEREPEPPRQVTPSPPVSEPPVVGKAIGATPPTVRIVDPRPGQRFFGQQLIIFDARGYDEKDAWPLQKPLEWSSDRDGPLGSGQVARFAKDFSDGTHVITVSATDSDGLVGRAQVTITTAEWNTELYKGPKLLAEMRQEKPVRVGETVRCAATVMSVGTEDTAEPIVLDAEVSWGLAHANASGPGWTCDPADDDGPRTKIHCTYPASVPLAKKTPPLSVRGVVRNAYDASIYVRAMLPHGPRDSSSSDACSIEVRGASSKK